MELSDSALEQMKKDLDNLVISSNERECKAAKLAGQYDVVQRILVPLGLTTIVAVEMARLEKEAKVLLKEKDDANMQLDTISAMLKEHRESRERKEEKESEDGTDTPGETPKAE